MVTILQTNNNHKLNKLLSMNLKNQLMMKKQINKEKIPTNNKMMVMINKIMINQINKMIIQIIFTKKDNKNKCKLINKDKNKKSKILKKISQNQLPLNTTKLLSKIIKKEKEPNIRTQILHTLKSNNTKQKNYHYLTLSKKNKKLT